MTRIEALRQIVATNKAAKLDGHVVDTFTAARLLESYKALDGAGRRRFASMSVDKMVTADFIDADDKKRFFDAIALRIDDMINVASDLTKEIRSTGIVNIGVPDDAQYRSGDRSIKHLNKVVELLETVKHNLNYITRDQKSASIPSNKMVAAGRAEGEKALKYVDRAVERAIAGIVQADKDFLNSGVTEDEINRTLARPIRMMFKAAINKKWPRPNID